MGAGVFPFTESEPGVGFPVRRILTPLFPASGKLKVLIFWCAAGPAGWVDLSARKGIRKFAGYMQTKHKEREWYE